MEFSTNKELLEVGLARHFKTKSGFFKLKKRSITNHCTAACIFSKRKKFNENVYIIIKLLDILKKISSENYEFFLKNYPNI